MNFIFTIIIKKIWVRRKVLKEVVYASQRENLSEIDPKISVFLSK